MDNSTVREIDRLCHLETWQMAWPPSSWQSVAMLNDFDVSR
jgi:hypothetical protein